MSDNFDDDNDAADDAADDNIDASKLCAFCARCCVCLLVAGLVRTRATGCSRLRSSERPFWWLSEGPPPPKLETSPGPPTAAGPPQDTTNECCRFTGQEPRGRQSGSGHQQSPATGPPARASSAGGCSLLQVVTWVSVAVRRVGIAVAISRVGRVAAVVVLGASGGGEDGHDEKDQLAMGFGGWVRER